MLRQSKWKDKPGCAGLEKIGFPKPVRPAAWPCGTAATLQPSCAPRDSLNQPMSTRVSQAVAEPPAEPCKEQQPSSTGGHCQRRKGPAFPCKDQTPQKSCTEEVFAGTSSHQREHECGDVFFHVQMNRRLAITSPYWASPAFKLLQHSELSQTQARLKGLPERCWFAADR